LAERVAEATWYHTIDLGDGIVTPGVYDLRPALVRLPLPESLEGARCLDVGTRNGFYAFEMERLGASEVVAIDVDSPDDIDFPEPRPPAARIEVDLATGRNAFEIAHEALGSSVRRMPLSVYRLDEQAAGRFDFAILGTLLWHLRDPVGALMAIRRVLDGPLLLNEGVSITMQALHPFGPAAQPKMERGRPFWWAANARGLERMVEAAGLDVERRGRPYLVPYGAGKPHRPWAHTLRGPLAMLPERLLLRRGAPQAWLLARPGPSELA
jgi:tRNA (mo5U34)-methyltransferase